MGAGFAAMRGARGHHWRQQCWLELAGGAERRNCSDGGWGEVAAVKGLMEENEMRRCSEVGDGED